MSILTTDWKAYIFLILGCLAASGLFFGLTIKEQIEDKDYVYDEPIYISQEFMIHCTGGNTYYLEGCVTNRTSSNITIDKIVISMSCTDWSNKYKSDYEFKNLILQPYEIYRASDTVKTVVENKKIKIDKCLFIINGEERDIRISTDGKDFNRSYLGGYIGGSVFLLIAILIICAFIYRYREYNKYGV